MQQALEEAVYRQPGAPMCIARWSPDFLASFIVNVHLENNVLFLKALALEASLTELTGQR